MTSSPRSLSRACTCVSCAAKARSSPASRSPASRSACSSASSDLEPRADRRGGFGERLGEPLGRGAQRLVARQPLALGGDPPLALDALALGALDQAPLAGERGLELRAPLGGRALVGRGPALLDHPAGVALGLGGLVALAGGRAGRAVGLVAGGVGGLDRPRGLLDLRERGLLGLRRALDLGDERVAPVALGQHAVLAAGGHLPQLARGR